MADIKNINKDAKFLDVVLLELPASINVHSGAMSGLDYAVGFFEGADEENVRLCPIQKNAYDSVEGRLFRKADITSYEILRRYEPKPGDGIDYVICESRGIEINNADAEDSEG